MAIMTSRECEVFSYATCSTLCRHLLKNNHIVQSKDQNQKRDYRKEKKISSPTHSSRQIVIESSHWIFIDHCFFIVDIEADVYAKKNFMYIYIYIYIYSYIFLSITSLFPFRWRLSRDFWEIQTDKVILGTKINTTKETSENVTGWVTFSLHVFFQSRVDFCSQIYLGYKQRKLTNEFGYRKVSGYTLMSFKT